MAMKFRIIKSIFKQGFQGVWRNRGMALASISSITAVLLILGIVLMLVLSINNIVMDTKEKFDLVEINLEDDISPKELNDIEKSIRENKNIESFVFESKEEALEIMRKDLGEHAYILEGVEDDNPLPNSFILKLRGIEYTDEVVKEFREKKGVERVPYFKDLIDNLMELSNYIRIGGLIVTITLVLISIFIISNTIKLTVASRSTEIHIMKYVGATNSYIKGPFLIEGVLFGVIAALISVVIIDLGYKYIFNTVNDRLYYMLSVYLISPSVVLKNIAIIFLAMGIGIGALGSILSLRKYLDV